MHVFSSGCDRNGKQAEMEGFFYLMNQSTDKAFSHSVNFLVTEALRAKTHPKTREGTLYSGKKNISIFNRKSASLPTPPVFLPVTHLQSKEALKLLGLWAPPQLVTYTQNLPT